MTAINSALQKLSQPVDILPLVIFRVAFGVLMFVSTLRFILNGWVTDFYVNPQFHFTYLGFDWVRSLPEVGMGLVFAGLLLVSILITVGLFYRVSMLVFFVLFTYVELIDKATYLNHYYFVSLLSFLLLFLPLHRKYSLDVWLRPQLLLHTVPLWMIALIRLQLAIVYVYAGIAKLNSDWMLNAMPMRIWLRANTSFPLIGELLFDKVWFAYLMSWAGAFYDLTIPFWLLWHKTRGLAYGAVVVFHLITAVLFPIGMFPYIMIVATLIFFDERDYARFFRRKVSAPSVTPLRFSGTFMVILGVFFVFQLLFPWRWLLYGSNLLWSQEGYRFGWRVMLTENTASATFHVRDVHSGREWLVFPSDYLTVLQEKQMSFQPDMIQQFAHFLAQQYAQQGQQVEVRAEVYASLNGRPSQLLIDPTVDLAQEPINIWKKDWILPLSSSLDS
jgi:hypothetical protein